MIAAGEGEGEGEGEGGREGVNEGEESGKANGRGSVEERRRRGQQFDVGLCLPLYLVGTELRLPAIGSTTTRSSTLLERAWRRK